MYHNKCLFISIFDSNKHLSNYRKSTILRWSFQCLQPFIPTSDISVLEKKDSIFLKIYPKIIMFCVSVRECLHALPRKM